MARTVANRYSGDEEPQYVTYGEQLVLEEMEEGVYTDDVTGNAYYNGCGECTEDGETECIGHLGEGIKRPNVT